MPAQSSDLALADQVAKFYANPLGFVNWAWDWDIGQLLGYDGPEPWQGDFLRDLGKEIQKRRFDGIKAVDPIRFATASGHGSGKSALVAWLIMFILGTRPHSRGIVTANTGPQLETKTWPELAKWRASCIIGHWFKISTARGALRLAHTAAPETWRCDGVTWREGHTEAFAGLHAANSTPFFIFDEGSILPASLWEVAEGGLTDGEPMMAVFGNPTRNSGAFRECFGRFRHRWITRQVDSRQASITNKQLIQQWIDDYGEDSDFVRVRVKGMFPRVSSMQFIGNELAEEAADPKRDPPVTVMDPLVMAVDVARFGQDASVISFRRGRDARTIPWLRLRGVDTMTLAARVADEARQHRPDAIFIDGGGVGGGVVDRCRQLRLPVVEVQFGAKSDRSLALQDEGIVYANKRAEMWGSMREWLKYGAIPNDRELIADLTGVEYGYVLREGRDAIILEKKDDMLARGLASPDSGDSLALGFAYPVSPSDHRGILGKAKTLHVADYDPYESMHGPAQEEANRRWFNAR